MRHTLKPACFAVIAFLILLTPTVQAQYGGGSGTTQDPYQIFTADQLNAIGLNEQDWDKHFLMMNDIDLSVIDDKAYNVIGNNLNMPFTGVFDGGGFRVLNFTYKSGNRDLTGLFGLVGQWNGDEAGEIRDLGLIDVNLNTGSGSLVGALAGWLARGEIARCHVSGGRILNRGNFSGGLIGVNSGLMDECFAEIAVDGSREVGGLAGTNESGGIIRNCYATGRVRGTFFVGGLVGDTRDTSLVDTCYAAGVVRGGSVDFAGGLVGVNSGEIVASFWDFQASSVLFMCGGEEDGTGCTGDGGKTTAQMRRRSTFSDPNWDFTTPIWKIDEGEDYPRLLWEVPAPIRFQFALDGNQVEDPVVTPARADAFLLLGRDSGELSWTIRLNGLLEDQNEQITSAGIYGPAAPGQVGTLQIDLLDQSVTAEKISSTSPVGLTEQQQTDVKSGLWYVQIATNQHPDGKVRGQALKQSTLRPEKVTIRADRQRDRGRDKLILRARPYLSTADTAPEDLLLTSSLTVTLSSVDPNGNTVQQIFSDALTIDDADRTRVERNGSFTYRRGRGEEGAIASLKLDFRKNQVDLTTKDRPLTGLRHPFKLVLSYGAYDGSVIFDQQNADSVNRGKPVPICLLAGQVDSLRVDRAVVRNNSQGGSLTLKGGLAAATTGENLFPGPVTVSWGDFSEVLPEGALTAGRNGSYSYRRPRDGEGSITQLKINLSKCTFNLAVRKGPPLTHTGEVVFSIVSDQFTAQDVVSLP